MFSHSLLLHFFLVVNLLLSFQQCNYILININISIIKIKNLTYSVRSRGSQSYGDKLRASTTFKKPGFLCTS
jgi:hypothetical protein